MKANRLSTRLKWLIFPGVNLHARLRYKCLPDHFGSSSEPRKLAVLDAGCGNGMLAYKSYMRGNKVLGISLREDEVRKCESTFNDHLGISRTELRFEQGNLYELDGFQDEAFDEIICSETIEHIKRDREVCKSFWRLLKPGGMLHLCAPNAEHPYNRSFPLDLAESGGHVRPGYTVESYARMLEPIGFSIEESIGVGGPVRQALNRRIKEAQERFGAFIGVPMLLVALGILLLERKDLSSSVPFSIYVKVRKPATQE